MKNSKIEWTDHTWNPWIGCTKVSEGCKHCYAERMAWRLQAMGQPNYANGFKLTLHEHALDGEIRRVHFLEEEHQIGAEGVQYQAGGDGAGAVAAEAAVVYVDCGHAHLVNTTGGIE